MFRSIRPRQGGAITYTVMQASSVYFCRLVPVWYLCTPRGSRSHPLSPPPNTEKIELRVYNYFPVLFCLASTKLDFNSVFFFVVFLLLFSCYFVP